MQKETIYQIINALTDEPNYPIDKVTTRTEAIDFYNRGFLIKECQITREQVTTSVVKVVMFVETWLQENE